MISKKFKGIIISFQYSLSDAFATLSMFPNDIEYRCSSMFNARNQKLSLVSDLFVFLFYCVLAISIFVMIAIDTVTTGSDTRAFSA